MKNKRTFTVTRRRHLMACILALITAIIMIPGMATYLPMPMIEQILLTIMLFPLIWTALFIYAYMAEKAWHPFLVMMLLLITHALLCYLALTGQAK
jgi:hypothetical protein